jgi:hypothetical protein
MIFEVNIFIIPPNFRFFDDKTEVETFCSLAWHVLVSLLCFVIYSVDPEVFAQSFFNFVIVINII